MTMELEKQLVCPACETPLYVIAEFKGNQRVRVGGCDTCGYMGYIDRPTKAWFDEFYKDKWDEQGQSDRMEKVIEYIKKVKKFPERIVPKMMMRTKPDLTRYALDIGCGFGLDMMQVNAMGFQKVYGLDSSKHRIDTLKKCLGYEAENVSFEDADLTSKAPFSVIYSSHVLEHAQDPNAFIKKCSELQKEGDFLLTAIPNNLKEPTVGVLMYLPHLHSFTITALMRLFGKHGYEIIDSTLVTATDLNVIAIKRSAPMGVYRITGFMNDGVSKLLKGLDMKKRLFNTRRRLIWSMYGDNGKQLPLWKKPKGFVDPRSLIVKQGKVKVPIQFEFKGNVQLFVK